MDHQYEIEFELTQKDLNAYYEFFFAKGNKVVYTALFALAYFNLVFWGLSKNEF